MKPPRSSLRIIDAHKESNMVNLIAFIFTTLFISASFGHVHLLTPTGDDVLEVGATYEISWQTTIPHETVNWDLQYATESLEGPWHDIAVDLPVGDNSSGSIHAYDWVVPDTPSNTVWIRVIQDNTDGNYDDTNDLPCVIVTPTMCGEDVDNDGTVGVTDLLLLIDAWGSLLDSPSDINGDGIVNVADLLLVVDAWGSCK
jgi:hypothetical protein